MIDAKQMMRCSPAYRRRALVVRVPVWFFPGRRHQAGGCDRKWNNIDLSLDLRISYTLLSGMVGDFPSLVLFRMRPEPVQRY